MPSLVVILSNNEPRLFQLNQNSVGARRVDERHERALRARAWPLVDEPSAAGPELRKRRVDVVHSQRDVMQARTAVRDVLRDGRIRRRRLEQFEAGFAGW